MTDKLDVLQQKLKGLTEEQWSEFSEEDLTKIKSKITELRGQRSKSFLSSAASFVDDYINTPLGAFFESAAQTVTETGLGIGAALGLEDTAEVTQQSQKRRAEIAQDYDSPIASTLGDIAGSIGTIAASGAGAAAKAIPQGVSLLGKGATFLGQTAAVTLPVAVQQSVQQGDNTTQAGLLADTAKNELGGIATGAVLGAAMKGGSELISQVGKRLAPRVKTVMQEFNNLGVSADKVSPKVVKSADDLGTFLTPGELTKDPRALQFERNIATDLAPAKLSREKTQELVISKLINKIGPKNENITTDASSAINKALSTAKDKLNKEADVLYKKAYNEVLKPEQMEELFQNPLVATAAKDLINISKGNGVQAEAVRQAFSAFPENSVGKMDLVLRHIQTQLDDLYKSNNITQVAAEPLKQAKLQLREKLTEMSPTLRQAKSIWSEGVDELEQLSKGTPLGAIAKQAQDNKNPILRQIFKPENIKSMTQIRGEINKQDSKIWGEMVRDHIDTTLKSKAGGSTVENFTKSFLTKPSEFNVLKQAVKGDKVASKMLDDMQRVFTRALKAKANPQVLEEGLTGPLKQKLVNFLNAEWNRKITDVITTDKFTKEITRIQQAKNINTKTEMLIDFLSSKEFVAATTVPYAAKVLNPNDLEGK